MLTPMTGLWITADHTQYCYMTQAGTSLWGFAEARGREFAFVFEGMHDHNFNAQLCMCQFADVPKSQEQGCGSLVLRLLSDNEFVIAEKNGRVTSPVFVRTVPDLQPDPIEQTTDIPSDNPCSPAYESDMSGLWLGDDGGRYYVRQVGSFVWWVGERCDQAWCNVLHGRLDGNQLTAKWADVPKWGGVAVGSSGFNVGSTEMWRSSQEDSRLSCLTKASAQTLKVRLTDLYVADTEEDKRDEPYLWPFYFTVGGLAPSSDVVPVRPPMAFLHFWEPIPYTDSGRTDLPTRAGKGESVQIPAAIGKFMDCVTTVRVNDLNVAKDSTFVGVAVVALERDSSHSSAMIAARGDISLMIQEELRAALRTFHGGGLYQNEMRKKLSAALSRSLERVAGKIRAAGLGTLNPDDYVGTASRLFSYAEIEGRQLPLHLVCRGGGGEYHVNGQVGPV